LTAAGKHSVYLAVAVAVKVHDHVADHVNAYVIDMPRVSV